MVEGRTFNIHPGTITANIEQVTNLLCAQENSASYPQQNGK